MREGQDGGRPMVVLPLMGDGMNSTGSEKTLYHICAETDTIIFQQI